MRRLQVSTNMHKKNAPAIQQGRVGPCHTYRMQLLHQDQEEELTFDVANFHTVLQMQSYYFQKTCKDLLNTGGVYVELQTSKDRVG